MYQDIPSRRNQRNPSRHLLDPGRPNRDPNRFFSPGRRGKLFNPGRHPQYRAICHHPYRTQHPTQQRSARCTLSSVQQHDFGACRLRFGGHHLSVRSVRSVWLARLDSKHHTDRPDALQGVGRQDGRFRRQPCRSVRSRCLPPVEGLSGNEEF